MEEFRKIENYNYSISNHGNVQNDTTKQILKNFINGPGYYQVILNKVNPTCI